MSVQEIRSIGQIRDKYVAFLGNMREVTLTHLLFFSACGTVIISSCTGVSQMAEQNHPKTAMCPKFEEAVSLLGKKWTGLILHVLLTGSTRFKEIKEMVPHMSDKMLAERLKELEECGIIERKVYPEIPVRIEYQLTDKGNDLEQVMASIRQWGERWM